ncbi:MAG: cell division protein SepF [Halanaerobiaceae bacterium]|nr:cell division protein SepF [Halanaerobiaceae bacterium]
MKMKTKVKLYWDKILDFFGFNQEPEEKEEIIQKDDNNRIISIYKKQGLSISVHSPESFSEVQNVVDHLKSKKPVILNLEKLERETARRVVDFISGAVYGLDGNVQKISDVIFLFTPYNVQIDGDVLKKNKPIFK